MALDNPDRYDLNQATEPDSLATMERHPRGDYVLASAFDELVEAYNERGDLLKRIGELAERA